jgi:3-oxoacyl-[acyl-carrier protein] reductase
MVRWALITAGGQGLGEAFVRHLAKRGYDPFIQYYGSESNARALCEEVRAMGRQAEMSRADLSESSCRIDLMEAVEERIGDAGLQLLVNNLGVYPMEHLLETSIAVWERTFSLTCTAAFHLTQLALPMLRLSRPPARVINIGDSGCDRVEAHDDATPYHIAKLGVHVLTRTYAQRLGPEGINVNMISPGFLENSVGRPFEPIPAGRKGRFEDIMGALDFLISPEAEYVNGANLVVSGGFNLGG